MIFLSGNPDLTHLWQMAAKMIKTIGLILDAGIQEIHFKHMKYENFKYRSKHLSLKYCIQTIFTYISKRTKKLKRRLLQVV